MCTHIDQALRPGGITQQHVARVGSWEILVVGENARIGVDAVGCAKCRELENAESDLRHHEYRKTHPCTDATARAATPRPHALRANMNPAWLLDATGTVIRSLLMLLSSQNLLNTKPPEEKGLLTDPSTQA